MITQTLQISKQKSPWQRALMEVVTDLKVLASILDLELEEEFKTSFPLRVPKGFIEKMKKGDRNDPLLLQILPVQHENIITQNFSLDPVQDLNYNPCSGILHKFKNRVLLPISGSCAINCRYCFRRYFPYDENKPSLNAWDEQLNYIKERSEVVEVILSGGDPLMTTDHYLKKLIEKLETIPHIKYLRIHTRIPIVIPERINDSLLSWLKNTRFKTTVVLHCNHPQELCQNIAKGVEALKNINITVLNQSVLLKGINDKVSTLAALSFALHDHGILPYYINLLDRVQGTHHFQVSPEVSAELIRDLACELPGFLLPRFVRDVPGAPHKIVAGVVASESNL